MTVPRHQEAVGGFFSATQERVVSTSFEGGKQKWCAGISWTEAVAGATRRGLIQL